MKIVRLFKQNIYLILLSLFVFVFAAVNFRINIFSYNNFDFGKFDLGNMSQMLWNTMNGRFMYMTDYFGTNVPRWAMSHVDPILLLFLPLFYFFPHPLTLVFSQIALVSLSAFLIYKIAKLELKSDFFAFLIGIAYLSYPALGYLTAKTTYHGISIAIFFFLATFYIFEKIYYDNITSNKVYFLGLFLLFITLTGKEQISLYIILYGIFLLLFRAKNRFEKYGAVGISVASLLWFVAAFFIIIPRNSGYRIQGYNEFAQSLDINTQKATDVALPNYFLSRYGALGDSYSDIIKSAILKPELVIKIFFGGDKMENFTRTFYPTLFLPFGAPQILIIAAPDFLINYLTTGSGIGTSEIGNHRISMIIPILFLASIFFFKFIRDIGAASKFAKLKVGLFYILVVSFAASNIYLSFQYDNPVFLWIQQAIVKRLPVFTAEAKTAPAEIFEKQHTVGDVIKITALENKDRDCAQRIVDSIPGNVSVSGPDYLGAHLSLRKTYAIFPALYNKADYVIVDVFSRKILTILNLEPSLIKDVVRKVSLDPNYQLVQGCGNLFVFKRSDRPKGSTLLPIQERYSYEQKYDFPIYGGLSIVDYEIPKSLQRGKSEQLKFVYSKKEKLVDYFLFFTLINKSTGEIYQIANLPSFAVFEPEHWEEDYFYVESLELVVPEYINAGSYETYVGMTNNIKNRSVYLGDVELK